MKIPRGKLIPIGGNEARDDEADVKRGILQEIINEMSVKNPVIEVIPAASMYPDEVEARYREAFGKLGYEINVMNFDGKRDVDRSRNLERISNAHGVFLTGGDQLRLKDTIEGTELLRIIKDRYMNEEFVVAGTSAGAMIMSEKMINTGANQESVLKGIVRLTDGFDFLPGTIIDTHFFNRGRFARLTEALLQKHKLTGIGISENSGVVVTAGNLLRCIGRGTVLIIDNHEIRNTNYTGLKAGEPVFVENLIVHILAQNAAYMLKEKEFTLI